MLLFLQHNFLKMDKKVWAMGYKEEIQAYASEWQIKLGHFIKSNKIMIRFFSERCMQFTNCGLGIALGDEIKLAFHDCKNYCISGNWYQAFECSNNFHCVGYQRKAEKMGNDACFRINNPSADLYEKICE
ncbi:hypothetical protein T4C_1894 [Trichinella pseudospiralis]|uniref:Apple domain-containing protein n=1 Tax=Trichinella pseudospiralis TaxID=6337 RepID=A0A0V1K9J2_TRIPS|nr:hypothetical protein T4C_1894 [Trichinella pseudospiralis]